MFSPCSFFDINNLVIILFLNLATLLGVLVSVLNSKSVFKKFNWAHGGYAIFFLSQLHGLVSDIARQNTKLVRVGFIPYFLFLFGFIFICNLVGMIPFSLTITSYIIITFFCSFSTMVAVTIIGMIYNGFFFSNIFFSNGVPLVMGLLLVPLEILSNVSKIFSLAIRLFANMMSGHILLKILMGFVFSMLQLGSYGLIAALAPGAVIFAVVILELVIAFLQSYVFIVLVSIYLNDVLFLH